MCNTKRLKGKKLSVSRVPVSSSILVEGLEENIAMDTVENYFESKRSHGGPVEKVHMQSEERRCCVYFEDSAGVWT